MPTSVPTSAATNEHASRPALPTRSSSAQSAGAPRQSGLPVERLAPPAAAAGAHDRLGLERNRDVRPDHGLELVLARQPQQVAAGLAGLAAPQPPGRAVAPPRLLEIPAPVDEV